VQRSLREAPPTHAEVRADLHAEAPKRGRPSKADDALVDCVWQLLVVEDGR
jgi:hypothetical protein